MNMAMRYSFVAFSLVSVFSSSCSKKDKETVEDSTAAAAISDNTVTSVVTLGTTKVSAAPGALAVGSEVAIANTSDPEGFAMVFASAPKASNAVAISIKDEAGNAVTTVNGQLSINLEYSDSAGLVVDKTPENLCVFGLDANNSKYVWRRSFLSVDNVNHILRFATKMTGTFQAAYCGSEALDGFTEAKIMAPPITDTPASELEGAWVSACTLESSQSSSYTRTQLLVSGNKLSYISSFHLSSDTCDTKNMHAMIKVDFDVTIGDGVAQPAGAKKIDQTYTGIYVTPFQVTIQKDGHTEVVDFAENLNTSQHCGFSDWVNGKERDVTSCPDMDMGEKGKIFYSIFLLDSQGNLCLGKDSDDPNSETSDATRPTAVETGDGCLVRM